MLINELLSYNPDIACLQVINHITTELSPFDHLIQEVDRLEKLLPPLHDASLTELYAAGRDKRHGCMIVYRESLFEEVGHVMIEYDELDVCQTGGQCERRGLSRRTKNVGLIVGLRQRNHPNCGYVVVTTHLFWHPS